MTVALPVCAGAAQRTAGACVRMACKSAVPTGRVVFEAPLRPARSYGKGIATTRNKVPKP
jgi:hypothetical protein